MKRLLSIIYLCFISSLLFAQLKVKNDVIIKPTKESVENFIHVNNFDYAIISWYTSTWMSSYDRFSGLVKQNGTWFLIKISNPRYGLSGKSRMDIKSKSLNAQELKTVLDSAKIDSAFLYSQDQLSALPDKCSYIKDGKPAGLYQIIDAATFHLAKYEQKEYKFLSYYAPKNYLSSCYPYFPEFGILKGLVNTCDFLAKVTDE